jgi:hypothetical protein
MVTSYPRNPRTVRLAARKVERQAKRDERRKAKRGHKRDAECVPTYQPKGRPQ